MDNDQRTRAAADVLRGFAGTWEGISRTWFEPGVLADESPIRGTIRSIGGSRFMLHEYDSEIQGQAFSGAAIYGYNQNTGAFESAWADSFHMSTNIMFASGQPGAEQPDVLGHYEAPEGPPWGWRTTIRLENPDRLVLTSYNVIPGEGEAKAVEIVYERRAA